MVNVGAPAASVLYRSDSCSSRPGSASSAESGPGTAAAIGSDVVGRSSRARTSRPPGSHLRATVRRLAWPARSPHRSTSLPGGHVEPALQRTQRHRASTALQCVIDQGLPPDQVLARQPRDQALRVLVRRTFPGAAVPPERSMARLRQHYPAVNEVRDRHVRQHDSEPKPDPDPRCLGRKGRCHGPTLGAVHTHLDPAADLADHKMPVTRGDRVEDATPVLRPRQTQSTSGASDGRTSISRATNRTPVSPVGPRRSRCRCRPSR